jgi:hypothetical protein
MNVNKIITYLVILFLMFFLFFFISKCEGNILKNEGIEGIGKIFDIKQTIKGKTTRKERVFIEYFYQKKRFVSTRTKSSNVKVGECYKLLFVPRNPSNMNVDFNSKVDCQLPAGTPPAEE